MKTEAEQRFQDLMKETIENTDFEDDLKKRLRELGYDKSPDIETLQKRAQLKKRESKRLKNSRQLKIAGFVLAVFVLSGAMTIFWHSDVALASRFAINNFMFSVQNSFISSDFQFNSTSAGRELIIEKEEQIPIGRNFLGELKIPGYIPEGYDFSSLHITNNARSEYMALFAYVSDDNTAIIIKQQKLSPHNVVQQITNIEKDFLIDDVHVFYAPCAITENNTIFVFTSTDLIQISGNLDLDELISILEKLN
jgi:hypothetical protein